MQQPNTPKAHAIRFDRPKNYTSSDDDAIKLICALAILLIAHKALRHLSR